MLQYEDAKLIVWSDFDGTITLQDSNDYLTDHLGFGSERRRELNQQVLYESVTFRDSFEEMLGSVKHPFEECKQALLENITLDPHFAAFYDWCTARQIPVVVVSSGMEPIIRSLLIRLLGERARHTHIISNDVHVNADGSWHIIFHDESHFGHDKSLAIKPYKQLVADGKLKMVYCGDGVSDLSAAKETNLLFAKEGRDLVDYCKRQNVPYTEFDSFADIHAAVRQLYEGDATLEDIAANRQSV